MPKKAHGNVRNKNAAKVGEERRPYSNRFTESQMDRWRNEAERAGFSVADVMAEQMDKWANRQEVKRKRK